MFKLLTAAVALISVTQAFVDKHQYQHQQLVQPEDASYSSIVSSRSRGGEDHFISNSLNDEELSYNPTTTKYSGQRQSQVSARIAHTLNRVPSTYSFSSSAFGVTPTSASYAGKSSAALSNPSANVQHHFQPADVITVATRPGLRSGLRPAIAPETRIGHHSYSRKQQSERIQHIPTAISHQRQTVVHNQARRVVSPGARSQSSSPTLHAYNTPLTFASYNQQSNQYKH